MISSLTGISFHAVFSLLLINLLESFFARLKYVNKFFLMKLQRREENLRTRPFPRETSILVGWLVSLMNVASQPLISSHASIFFYLSHTLAQFEGFPRHIQLPLPWHYYPHSIICQIGGVETNSIY